MTWNLEYGPVPYPNMALCARELPIPPGSVAAGFACPEDGMTLAEFRAWFEGFTETIEGAPTEAQFSRIKARVAEIDGKAITKEIVEKRILEIVDRYPSWPMRRYPYYQDYVTCSSAVGAVSDAKAWNAGNALVELGRAEYSAAVAL